MRLYEKEILNTLKKTNNLLDNINQAIFSINKDGEIIRPISKYSVKFLVQVSALVIILKSSLRINFNFRMRK